MTENNRKPLNPNTRLTINVNGTTCLEIVIGEVIAYGGSCIAYEGMLVFNDNRPVIIKEYYPSSQNITRDETTGRLVIPDETWFNQRKDYFRKGISRASKLFSEILVKDIFIYGDCDKTNTVYGVSLKGDGCTLKELVEKETLSISRMASIMSSLCKAISEVHKRGFFYLDIKPQNIYCDLDGKVQLFDFDNCIADSEAHGHLRQISYSIGWAAPEQLPSVIKKENFKVSRKTDIFSIGACFFWLLSGNKPYSLWDSTNSDLDFSIINNIEKEIFDYRKHFLICKHTDKVILNRITAIIRGTLAFHPNNRVFGSVNELRDAFEYLLRISSIENREKRTLPAKKQSFSRFSYDSGMVGFYGREEEIAYLISMCDNECEFCWGAICGSAGSGKTRLAFELCKEMEKCEWQVFWPCHAKSNINKITKYIDDICRDTLICFDDASTNAELISEFIRSCTETSIYSECKIRVVLIDRKKVEITRLFSQHFDYAYCNTCNESIIELTQLGDEFIKNIITDYAEKVYDERLDTKDVIFITDAIKRIWGIISPLYVLFSIDAWCQGNHIEAWDQRDATEYLRKKELDRIRTIINEAVTNKPLQDLYYDEIKLLIVKAAFLEGYSLQNVDHSIIERDILIWILEKAELFDKESELVISIKPDLFAEYLCYSIINELSQKTAYDLLRCVFSENYEYSWVFGAYIWEDYCESITSPRLFAPFRFIQLQTEELVGRKLSEKIPSDILDAIDELARRDIKAANEMLDSYLSDYKTLALQGIAEMKDYVLSHLDSMFYKGEKVIGDTKYNGEFVFSWICGKGECIYNDESRYIGDWFENKRHGKGTILAPQGTKYEGDWKYDSRDGFGRETYCSDSGEMVAYYEGDWKKDKKDGKGKMIWCDNTEYFGEWKDGKPNGYGEMNWNGERKYCGEWKNGKPNGYGEMIVSNGEKSYGEWREGVPHGLVTEEDDHFVKTGTCVNGKREGLFKVYNKANPEDVSYERYSDDVLVE